MNPVPGLTIDEQPAPALMRLCLWGESRGESAVGQLAVAWVIFNRSAAWHKTIREIILQPWQFSSFNTNDPNRAKLLDAPALEPRSWARVDTVCSLFEDGATVDVTSGAVHYYVADMPNPPKWGRGSDSWKETAVIGRHVFGVAG